MSIQDTRFESETVGVKADHKMNPTFKFQTSEEGHDKEKITDIVSDNEDSEVIQRSRRTSSVNDDSGFNSSASEDRDDVTEIDNVKGLVAKNLAIKKHTSQNSLLKSDRLKVCEPQTSRTLVQNCEKHPLEKIASSDVNSTENKDSVLLIRCDRNIGSNSVPSNNNSPRSVDRIRRQRTDNGNSLVTSGAPANARIFRNRRHRSRDMNNNDDGHKNFNSYLRKSPFKLQDCFQDQGLLSLAACVTYTFALMIVFCVLGVVFDSIKSFIGPQNLKDIRENIVQSRRTRTTMASG